MAALLHQPLWFPGTAFGVGGANIHPLELDDIGKRSPMLCAYG